MSKEWTLQDIIELIEQGILRLETEIDEHNGCHIYIHAGKELEDALLENAAAIHWYLRHVTPIAE
jgi:exonuclease VII small subunit